LTTDVHFCGTPHAVHGGQAPHDVATPHVTRVPTGGGGGRGDAAPAPAPAPATLSGDALAATSAMATIAAGGPDFITSRRAKRGAGGDGGGAAAGGGGAASPPPSGAPAGGDGVPPPIAPSDVGSVNDATEKLLHLVTASGTTPADLLSLSVGGGGRAADVVAAALTAGAPIVVGGRIIRATTIEDLPYPVLADALATETLRLQPRSEPLRGRITVGAAAGSAGDDDGGAGWDSASASASVGGGSAGDGAGGGAFSATSADTLGFTTSALGRADPVTRVGPQTAKLSASTARDLAARPGGLAAAAPSVILPPDANDFMVPHGGTHPLVVPVV
jgi:hypothetical protein